jgi:hypothetical protein
MSGFAVAREFWNTFLAEAEDIHKALGQLLPVVESIATEFGADVEEKKIINHARRVWEHWKRYHEAD